MKKPKQRIPVAKPSKRHKSEKDYDRKKNSIQMLVCSKCKKDFFAVVIDKGVGVCMGCFHEKGNIK